MKTKVDEIGVDNVHQKCKSALGGAKRKFDGLAARCKDPLANSNGGGNNRFLQTVDGADLSAPPTEVPDAEKCNTRAKLAQT